MTDAPAATEETSSTEVPLGPPPVVVVKSESSVTTLAHWTHIRGGLLMMVIGAIIIPVFTALAWLFGGKSIGWRFVAVFFGAQLVIFALTAGRMVLRHWRAWKLDRKTFADEDDRHDKRRHVSQKLRHR